MAERDPITADVAVVGAGPAGIAAALAASSMGKRVCLLDEGFNPGGQIWRHRADPAPRAARRLLARLAQSSVKILPHASVFDAYPDAPGWRMIASTPEGRREVTATSVVLACGARERFLPFPGWTLPGVVGAGGGQALLKEGLELQGESVLVAGTGPLLLPVAASVRKAKGKLLGVLEQASQHSLLRMAPLLLVRPTKAWQAVHLGWALPYRPGWWVSEAIGTERLEAVRVSNGTRHEVMECRWLFCGFGLVPNLEMGRGLGCEARGDALIVDESQQTSKQGIFAAGEVCGIAGVDAALAEGSIAGLAAAGAWNPQDASADRLMRKRAKARRMGLAMDSIFRLRPELKALPRPDTLVCRCEDVSLGAIDPGWNARETKLCTRAGMGPCQGRVCGPILAHQFGHLSDSVRIPLKAAPLNHLIPEEP
jgi:D-hydroxyproline dehydrogenase subunit alpha